jgi:hypothetical protein
MSLKNVLQTFRSHSPGTDAYKEVKASCLNLARTDADNATAYFLVFGFARSYVLLFEEEAVPPDLAHRAQDQLAKYMELLCEGIVAGTAEARLSSLNAVVLDYLQSDRIF